MATIKKHEKQDDVAAHYLALAAISDIKCSVKETMAIQDLAIYLYNKENKRGRKKEWKNNMIWLL